jgi:hypothetical protein
MRRYTVPEWWSIGIPDGWRVTEHPECTTFEPPMGEGALQISAHRKDRDVADADLREFAGDVPVTPVTLPCFSGLENASTERQLFFRKLWLRAGHFMLFVTYVCPLGARGREDFVVEDMLRSLSLADVTQQA